MTEGQKMLKKRLDKSEILSQAADAKSLKSLANVTLSGVYYPPGFWEYNKALFISAYFAEWNNTLTISWFVKYIQLERKYRMAD